VLALAIALVGLAQGAEGDIGAYIASRHFPIDHYSFVFSFLIATIGFAGAIGALVLSAVLHRTDSFDPFLLLSAGATIGGALCFWLIGFAGGGGRPREIDMTGTAAVAGEA
jgi:hypothetical protein